MKQEASPLLRRLLGGGLAQERFGQLPGALRETRSDRTVARHAHAVPHLCARGCARTTSTIAIHF